MGDYTEPQDELFFAAIGRLTISWAHLETSLDMSAGIIHNWFPEDRVEPELPRALSRKLRYLRKAATTIPALAPFKDRFLDLIPKIEQASEDRHDIIHGAVVRHFESQDKPAKLTRLLWGAEMHDLKEIEVAPRKILKDAIRANKLASQSFGVARDLWDRFCSK